MHKYNLLINIEIPSDDVEAPIWSTFDEQINSHCLLHDIILSQNPTAEEDNRDLSNLAWELVSSNSRSHVSTYMPNRTLTRHSFNLKNLSKAPFGSRLPNHHLASSPNVFFLLISEFHPLSYPYHHRILLTLVYERPTLWLRLRNNRQSR